MTVSATTPLVTYDGAGTTGPFAIPFKFLDSADIAAVKTGVDGVETTLTDNVITGAGLDTGGTLTTAAVVAVGEELRIYRETALEQTASYVPNGPFPAKTHEGALDKLMLVAQEAKRDLDGLSLQLPLGVVPVTRAQLDVLSPLRGRVAMVTDESNAIAFGNGSRWQRHIVRNYLEDFGARGGETDAVAAINEAAFATAFAAGVSPTLRRGTTYAVGNTLSVPQNVYVRGEPEAEVLMTANGFNNTNPAQKTGNDCLLFDLSGLTTGPFTPKMNVGLEGFRIRYAGTDAHAIRAVRSSNAEVSIVGLEICNMPLARGIVLNSQTGDWEVRDCYIHDFYSNAVLGNGQITAVEIDDDKVNSVASMFGRWENIDVRDITLGPAAVAAYGLQTDAFTINADTFGLQMINCSATRVDEAVDCWGDQILCYGLSGRDIRGALIKLIHGAQNCLFQGGGVNNWGLWGIVIAGSATRAVDTAFNIVENVSMRGAGDFQGYWASLATPAAAAFVHPNTPIGIARDNVIRNCRLDAGGAEFAFVDAETNGLRNRVVNCTEVAGTSGNILISSSASTKYLSAIRTDVHAVANAVQTLALGSNQIILGLEVVDARNEYDPTTGVITIGYPKRVDFNVALRLPTVTAGRQFTLDLQRAPASAPSTFTTIPGGKQVVTSATTADLDLVLAATYPATTGDRFRLVVNNGDTVARDLSNSGEVCQWFCAERETIG